MAKRRGRNTKLTDEMKKALSSMCKENLSITVKEARYNLISIFHSKIKEDVKKRFPEWSDKDVEFEVNERLPGVSTVQKSLEIIKGQIVETKELNESWSMGTLTRFPISSEAIPKVLGVQQYRKDKNGGKLTVREAKWIGYLYLLSDNILDLNFSANLYAMVEEVCELSGISNDTSELDEAINSHSLLDHFFIWAADKKWISDSYKVQEGSNVAKVVEGNLGLNLKTPNFTGRGWMIYASLLLLLLKKEGWSKLSKRELKRVVSYLRDAALKEVLDVKILDNLLRSKIEKEVQNEGTHNQAVQ